MVMTARVVIVIGLVCGGIAGGLFGVVVKALEEGGAPDVVRGVALGLKDKIPRLAKLEDAERAARGAIEFVVGFGLMLVFGGGVWAVGYRGASQVLPESKPLSGQPPSPGELLSPLRKAIPYVLALAVFLAAWASLEGVDHVAGATAVSAPPAIEGAVVGAAWGAVAGLVVYWLGRRAGGESLALR
jgi:hypothetical protein